LLPLLGAGKSKGEVYLIASVMSVQYLNEELALHEGSTKMGFLNFHGVAHRACYELLPPD